MTAALDLSAVITLATKAHEGQVDKAGRPYILHPISVMQALMNDGRTDDYLLMTAVLHDVIEDTEYTTQNLFNLGIATRVVDNLIDLTHRKNEPYDEYIDRIMHGSHFSWLVKVYDIQDNYNRLDTTLAQNHITNGDHIRMKRKYEAAMIQLGVSNGN